MSPRLARTISTLCLLLLSASAFGALSSEFAVSEIVLQPAELTQRDAVAATDGTDFFSAWVDDRTGPVEGSIRYDEWTDKDGNKRNTTKIRVSGPGSRLVLLGGRGEGGPRGAGESREAAGPAADENFQASDDDVPF